MHMEIGAKGLQEVNLTIPQATSLTFDVVHTDDDGDVIDHSSSTARMAFQTRDKQTTYQMDECVSCEDDKIRVTIPASMTEELPLGKMLWDIIVTTESGEQVRLCYGNVNVVDTYAFDEEG